MKITEMLFGDKPKKEKDSPELNDEWIKKYVGKGKEFHSLQSLKDYLTLRKRDNMEPMFKGEPSDHINSIERMIQNQEIDGLSEELRAFEKENDRLKRENKKLQEIRERAPREPGE